MAWSDFFLPSGTQSYDDAQANYDAQKATLAAQQTLLDPTSTEYQINADALGGALENQNQGTEDAFVSGLGDGLTNIKNSLTGFGLFKLVPIWLWIVAAIAIFVWIGGLEWSKGKLRR